MLKIISAEQTRAADSFTVKSKKIKSVDLMEDAAAVFVRWFQKKFSKKNIIHVYCGLGNNGGDGLAIARLLINKNYSVKVFIIRHGNDCSQDFLFNEQRLKEMNKIPVENISHDTNFKIENNKQIIVDAIFGSGLNKPVSGLIKKVILQINQSHCKVVSVDIPSGLFADKHTDGIAVKADYTLSFQLPKLAFLFSENNKYVGEWQLAEIGLDKKFIQKLPAQKYFITGKDIQKIIKPRNKFSHKGTFGNALMIAGSMGKMGAALLSAKACLRSGAGLLTVHVPKCGYQILQRGFPEAMASIDRSEKYFSKINQIEKFDAIGIGPGIGTGLITQKGFLHLLKQTNKPVVIDADAINILGIRKEWIKFISPNSILTPHPKEFERLAGKAKNDFHRHEMQIRFAMKYQIYLVLKTAYTCIAAPDGNSFFNSTGNPGMATAGSGDVLTGILTGLLAQGYSPLETCILGVYLHGLAGDIAAKKKSQEAMIASDIIDNIGEAFNNLQEN